MNGSELAYFAGVLDSEGTLSMNLDKASSAKTPSIIARLHISTSSEGLIEWLKEKAGGKSTVHHRPPWKPEYQWHLSGYERIKSLLLKIRPLLIVKAAHADILLQWFNMKIDRRKRANRGKPLAQNEIELLRQIRQLNGKGLSGKPNHHSGNSLYSRFVEKDTE